MGGAFGIALVGTVYFTSGGGLAGLIPGAMVVAVLLAIAVMAVSRLPANLFGVQRKAPAH